MRGKLIILFVASSVLLFTRCDKDEPVEENPAGADFNKQELLENVADNIIVSQYAEFQMEMNSLSDSYAEFLASPSDANLSLTKVQLETTYKAWNRIKAYEFGPAMDIGFRSAVGIFPTDTTKVRDNITSGSYNLGTVDNVDAIGLSAIEYLVFQTNALADFADVNYQQYVSDLIAKIQGEINNVCSAWTSSYASTFKTSTGTESTSGFSLLVNEFNKDYELAKNAKLGIPLGKQSLDIQRPEYVEAAYSGMSLGLLRENVASSKRLFNGTSLSGNNGKGFDDYLQALDKSDLVETINSRYDDILNTIDNIESTLLENLDSNPAVLDELYTKMADLVVYIKTDMTSAFGVLITYQDNDGD